MGFWMVSLGKQKIQELIAIYKSLADLGSMDFRNLFPLVSYCNNKPKAEYYPNGKVCRSRQPSIGNNKCHLLKIAVPGHVPDPDLEVFTVIVWPGCLQAFLRPFRLLAPGLLAFGRLAALHPRRSAQGSSAARRRGL